MKKQLSTLQQLLQVMDPELYRHFEKTEGLNLFFCFRYGSPILQCLVGLFIKVGQLDTYLVQARVSVRGCLAFVGGFVDGLLHEWNGALCRTRRTRVPPRRHPALPRRV